MSGPREAVLARVRAALTGRERPPHPGPFPARATESPGDPTDRFTTRFAAAGGSVVRCAADEEARGWVAAFREGFEGVALGAGVPAWARHREDGEAGSAPAERAALGISVARAAVAETGSVVLDARDGRRAQLLPPTHLVIVRARDVHETLAEALAALGPDPSSALALHSGPSKSADIGQVLVTGVHGPGRVIVLLLGG